MASSSKVLTNSSFFIPPLSGLALDLYCIMFTLEDRKMTPSRSIEITYTDDQLIVSSSIDRKDEDWENKFAQKVLLSRLINEYLSKNNCSHMVMETTYTQGIFGFKKTIYSRKISVDPESKIQKTEMTKDDFRNHVAEILIQIRDKKIIAEDILAKVMTIVGEPKKVTTIPKFGFFDGWLYTRHFDFLDEKSLLGFLNEDSKKSKAK